MSSVRYWLKLTFRTTARFLDDIKKLGFTYSFRGGPLFQPARRGAVPDAEEKLVKEAV
jgi:hypothetical protein